MADLLLTDVLEQPPFTWGACNLAGHGQARTSYIKALQEADRNNGYEALLAFARS
jgi:hypothetical protein